MASKKKPRMTMSFYQEDVDPALWWLFSTYARNHGDRPGRVLSELMELRMREICGPSFDSEMSSARRYLAEKSHTTAPPTNEPE